MILILPYQMGCRQVANAMISDQNTRIVVLGGGGHAKVVVDTITYLDAIDCIGVLDNDPSLWGTCISGAPILGNDDIIPDLISQGVSGFIVGIGSIGDNKPREYLFKLGIRYGLKPVSVIHPSAVCSQFSVIGRGSVVFPLAVINASAELGINVIVNTSAIVEHDCYLGDHSHVASGGRLCGAVELGDRAHVGAGATVLQGVIVGTGAIVGAGSVVVDNVPSGTVVAGIPARFMKNVPE